MNTFKTSLKCTDTTLHFTPLMCMVSFASLCGACVVCRVFGCVSWCVVRTPFGSGLASRESADLLGSVEQPAGTRLAAYAPLPCLPIVNLSCQWAKENGLLLEAYSPLGSNNQVKKTLSVPEVQAIAKELDITPAQVVISWHVQRGVRTSVAFA